jgi:metal-responsive CopG/Arc/MetJ family transcriptional regulator
VQVRIQPDLLALIDQWIEAQPDPKPSRPEAIRRLVEQALKPEA